MVFRPLVPVGCIDGQWVDISDEGERQREAEAEATVAQNPTIARRRGTPSFLGPVKVTGHSITMATLRKCDPSPDACGSLVGDPHSGKESWVLAFPAGREHVIPEHLAVRLREAGFGACLTTRVVPEERTTRTQATAYTASMAERDIAALREEVATLRATLASVVEDVACLNADLTAQRRRKAG